MKVGWVLVIMELLREKFDIPSESEIKTIKIRSQEICKMELNDDYAQRRV